MQLAMKGPGFAFQDGSLGYDPDVAVADIFGSGQALTASEDGSLGLLSSYRDGSLGCHTKVYQDGVLGSDLNPVADGVLGSLLTAFQDGSLGRTPRVSRFSRKRAMKGLGATVASSTARLLDGFGTRNPIVAHYVNQARAVLSTDVSRARAAMVALYVAREQDPGSVATLTELVRLLSMKIGAADTIRCAKEARKEAVRATQNVKARAGKAAKLAGLGADMYSFKNEAVMYGAGAFALAGIVFLIAKRRKKS